MIAAQFRFDKSARVDRSLRPRLQKSLLLRGTKIFHDCIRIEHNSAGDRFLLRRVPHHEAIADEGKNRRFETKLGHKRITHGERLPILKKQSRGKISATVVDTHDSTVLKRWRL